MTATPAPGTNRTNRAEYELRRRNLAGPLADVRGAAPVGIVNLSQPNWPM